MEFVSNCHRLGLSVSHMSKGLKSPMPKKAPLALTVASAAKFHKLGGHRSTTTDNGVPRAYAIHRVLATVKCCTIGGHRTPAWVPLRAFGRQSNMSRLEVPVESIARQFWVLPFVCTKGINVFDAKSKKLTPYLK